MLFEKEARWILQSSRDTMPRKDYESFARLLRSCPDRVSLLHKPLEHFAEGHARQRVTAGPLAGIEGYIVRIDRDRKLVTRFGPVIVSIAHAHKEKVEEVTGCR